MATRCGCSGDSGANVQGRYGVTTVGTGTANNPVVARFDPRQDSILGDYLTWDESQKKLSGFVSHDPGNAIVRGSDGGLWSSGSGGGPLPSYGATVQALPATNVVGGIGGVGYLLAADSTLDAYRAAVAYGLDVTYVPVKGLSDSTTVVCPDQTLARFTQGYAKPGFPDQTAKRPADLDRQSWRMLPMMAGKYEAASGVNGHDGLSAVLNPGWGYFGHGEKPQDGGTFVADVAREIGNQTVLVLHTEEPDDYHDLMHVITVNNLWQSVIVVSSQLAIITSFAARNIPAGLYHDPVSTGGTMPTPAQVKAAGGTWAVLGKGHTDNEFDSFKSAGINTLMMWAKYHSDWDRVNNALGIRGALSGDPVYYNGPATGYNYKAPKNNHLTWSDPTMKPGQFIEPDAYDRVVPNYRGFQQIGQSDLTMGALASWRTFYPDDPLASDTQGSWFVQPGAVLPIVEGKPADTYAVVWRYQFEAINAISIDSAMVMVFGVQKDHGFRDGSASTGPLDQGYAFFEMFDGRISLWDINGTGGNRKLADGKLAAHTSGQVIQRGLAIQQDKIMITDQNGTPLTPAFSVTGTPSYHGGYIYLGKRDYRVDGSRDGNWRLKIAQVDTFTPWPQSETLAGVMRDIH